MRRGLGWVLAALVAGGVPWADVALAADVDAAPGPAPSQIASATPPAPRQSPAISVDPDSAPPGMQVTVSGSELPSAPCDVRFGAEIVVGDDDCDVNADGTLSETFAVPSDAQSGAHRISVWVTPGDFNPLLAATTSFTVTQTTPATTTPERPEPPPVVEEPVETNEAAPDDPTEPGEAAPGGQSEPGGEVAGPTLPASCTLDPSRVQQFAVTPSRGQAGSEVTIAMRWAALDPSCAGTGMGAGRLTFDGEPIGDPVPAEQQPPALTWTIPPDAADGPHTIALVVADDESQVLASAPFEVASSGGGFPWLPVALGTLGGGALVATWARRRRSLTPPAPGAEPDIDQDPCSGPRQVAEEARAEAERARAEAERAQQRARAAEERAEQPRQQLAQCEQQQGRGRPMLPFVLPLPTQRQGSAYLLEHENPHAPRRANGQRGWYRTQRSQAIRGIVVHLPGWLPGLSGSAAEAASDFAVVPRPASAHALVDTEGVVELLPDDHAAFHARRADEATLAVVLAEWGRDPDRDEQVLGHLARWCVPKVTTHRVPAQRITGVQWRSGEGGFLAAPDLAAEPGAPAAASPLDGFPWERLLELVSMRQPRSLPGAIPGKQDPCADVQARVDQAESESEQARREAEEAEQRAREAEQRAEEQAEQLGQCEGQGLPGLDQLIREQEEQDRQGRHYLLEHENPNAPLLANGKQGWYYPTRSAAIRGIVVHTAEALDLSGPDESAEGVARYLAGCDRTASAHVAIDTSSTVPLLPDIATAFHARGGNSAGLGIEIAYEAARWGQHAPHEQLLLMRAAVWCGLRARLYRIPVRRITVDEWEAGERGFISHAELDPSRRTDPGPDFPWNRFMTIAGHVAGRSLRQEAS